MPGRNKIFPSILFALAFLFAFGLVQLFLWRFEAGDVYPSYSSLRADPLGTKALYEALRLLPRMDVERNYRPLPKLTEETPSTVLFLGSKLELWTQDVETLEAVVRQGGRLVMALYPSHLEKRPRPEEKKMMRSGKVKEKQDEPPEHRLSLGERWKFSVDYARLPRNSKSATAECVSAEALPPAIPWHSTLVFTDLDDSWRVVYARDKQPVLIERKLDRGTIVLASDCYFLSNEAMLRDRHPSLLTRLLGPNHHVIFEETHLGIGENPGVAALARRYRLHWLLAAVLLLAGLFVWKNSIPLVPPHPEKDGAADEVAGKDYASGFVNLLRRNIPRQEILNVCFAEWKKSFASGRIVHSQKLAQMESVIAEQDALPGRQRQPVSSYRTLSQILAERK